MSDERCALVLEGGAMRGMYTAGVLDCFMDHDISFDAVIGVSAGALFGVNLLSKQRGRARNMPMIPYQENLTRLMMRNIRSRISHFMRL